jgi:Uma2 family endonuclease
MDVCYQVATANQNDKLANMNAISPSPAMLEKARLRVEDFLMLNQSRAFDANRRVELIEGDVYYMNAQYRPHARLKAKFYDELRDWVRASGTTLTVMIEATVAMPPHNAPEPDLILTNEPGGDGPVPVTSVALIVEISDATLKDDLGLKAKIYADGGVREYWVADVNGRVIHQMWGPSAEGYADERVVAFGAVVTAATIDGLSVETGGLG